jgi:hypothetical protein
MGPGGDGPGGGGGGPVGSGSGGNNSAGKNLTIIVAVIGALGVVIAAIITGFFGYINAGKGSGASPPSTSASIGEPPALTVAPDATAPPPDVPAKFIRTWSGTQTQFDGSSSVYPTTITISAGRIHEKIGVADYPSFPCRFSLKLIDSTPASIDVDAGVISGDCTPPEMRFAVDGSDSLKYDMYYGAQRVGYGNVSRGHT